MATETIACIAVILGAILLFLCTFPKKNTLDGNRLTVKFVIGRKVIDMTGAQFKPVPEETQRNILRACGTSIGRFKSGFFYNSKTRTMYRFYLTGKGKQSYFEIGAKKYLVDGIQ